MRRHPSEIGGVLEPLTSNNWSTGTNSS